MTYISRYPGIKAASLEIAYDNGMINRLCPEKQFLEEVNIVLQTENEFYLKALDVWLQSLTKDALAIVCCGEESEAAEIETSCPEDEKGLRLTRILDNIFEVVG